MKRTIFGVCAGVALIGSSAFLARSSTSGASESAVSAAPEGEPRVQKRVRNEAKPTLTEAGPLHGYGLSVHNEFKSGDSGFLLGFEGRMTFGEVGELFGLTWSYVHPDAIEFTLDAGPGKALSAEDQAALAHELEQGYFVGRNAQGQIMEYRFARTPSSLSQGFLRMIAVTTQRVLPEGRSVPARFSVREVDTAGEAHVQYVQEGDGHWQKSKDAYTKVLSSAGLTEPDLTRTIHGEGQLVYRDDVLLTAILEERATLLIDQSEMQNDADVRIVAQDFEVTEDPAQLLSVLQRLAPVSAMTTPATHKRAEREKLGELLGDADLDDLTTAMAALDADDESGRRLLLSRYEADLKLHPEDADAVAARMAEASTREQSMLLSALSNADTPEASAALSRISQDARLPEDMRTAATALLGFSPEPDADAVVQLKRTSNDVRNPHAPTATLALGNLADSMREGDPEQAESIVDQLLERLKAARDPASAARLLSALGNSADPRLVEALEPWYVAEHPAVRANAFYALRLLTVPRAAELMAQAASADADAAVRARVLGGFVARPSELGLKVALQALARDPSADVRLEALNVLATMPSTEGATLIAEAAERDADATVRSTARSMLGGA